jgi:hypothetical protein
MHAVNVMAISQVVASLHRVQKATTASINVASCPKNVSWWPGNYGPNLCGHHGVHLWTI